jgi:hypothetical protein
MIIIGEKLDEESMCNDLGELIALDFGWAD